MQPFGGPVFTPNPIELPPPENNFVGAHNFFEKNNDLFNQPPARFDNNLKAPQ